MTLTKLYYTSLQNFDGHPIPRDVLVMLWLRLVQAATHTFSSRVYTDLKLNYQVGIKCNIYKLSYHYCQPQLMIIIILLQK